MDEKEWEKFLATPLSETALNELRDKVQEQWAHYKKREQDLEDRKERNKL